MDELQPRSSLFTVLIDDPVGVLRRRWRWALAVGVVGIAATFGFVFGVVEPVFSATSRVLVSSPRISSEFVRNPNVEDPFEKLNAVVGALLSRDHLLGLVEELDLYEKERAERPINEILNVMRSSVRIDVDASAQPGGRRGNDSAQVFLIEYTNGDAGVAASVANQLASDFVEESIRIRTEQARLTTEFLRREVERSEAALAAQNAKLVALREAAQGALPSELQANLNRLGRLQDQRASLALQIAQAEGRLVTTSQVFDDEDMSPEGRLERLKGRLAEVRALYTPEHPSVISIERQVEALEREIASGAQASTSRSALVAAAQRTIRELKAQLVATDSEITKLEARVAQTPAREAQLSELLRVQETLDEQYNEYQSKLQDAELAESLERAQQGQRISILEYAYPPSLPEHSRFRFVLLGVTASLLLALAVLVGFEAVDPVVVSERQIEDAFGVRVLGFAPKLPS